MKCGNIQREMRKDVPCSHCGYDWKGVLPEFIFPVSAEIGRQFINKSGMSESKPKADGRQKINMKEPNFGKTVLRGNTAEELLRIGNQYYFQKEYEEAAKWYRESAEKGNATAQNNLRHMFCSGKEVSENRLNFEKPVYRGNTAEEMLRIGNQYYFQKEYEEAVKWYRKSAEQGNAKAQNNLANMYCSGRRVKRDYEEAVKWYRESAKQGNAEAQNNFANMYYYGRGVKRDYGEAVKWYRESAKQGYAWGQNNLGNMYLWGNGVEQDYVEAVKWYRKSAEQGNDRACYSMGYMYEKGKGVPKKDYRLAVHWYKEAEKLGNTLAKSTYERVIDQHPWLVL